MKSQIMKSINLLLQSPDVRKLLDTKNIGIVFDNVSPFINEQVSDNK